MAAVEYVAQSPNVRIRDDIDRKRFSIAVTCSGIRHLWRERNGITPCWLEAHQRYRETVDAYSPHRWRTLR